MKSNIQESLLLNKLTPNILGLLLKRDGWVFGMID